MGSFDTVLNFIIPAILLLVAFGFVYTRAIEPMLIPLFKRMWEWLTQPRQVDENKIKEISYD